MNLGELKPDRNLGLSSDPSGHSQETGKKISVSNWDVLLDAIVNLKAQKLLIPVFCIDGSEGTGKTEFLHWLNNQLKTEMGLEHIATIDTDWALLSTPYRRENPEFQKGRSDHRTWYRQGRLMGLVNQALKAVEDGSRNIKVGMRYIHGQKDGLVQPQENLLIGDAIIIEGTFASNPDLLGVMRKHNVSPITLVVETPLAERLERIRAKAEERKHDPERQIQTLNSVVIPTWEKYWESIKPTTQFIARSSHNFFVIEKNPAFVRLL